MPIKNPPHLGDFIRTEIIEPAGLSVTAAAAAFRVSRPALSSLLSASPASPAIWRYVSKRPSELKWTRSCGCRRHTTLRRPASARKKSMCAGFTTQPTPKGDAATAAIARPHPARGEPPHFPSPACCVSARTGSRWRSRSPARPRSAPMSPAAAPSSAPGRRQSTAPAG